MRNKIFNILALGALLLATSCSLHDDNEIFDTPAAQRIEESIASDKALLESATNGWELHLWMGEDNAGGGYTYLMKFNNGKVSVGSEIADPDMRTSSSYDVIADEGPVLTFNTYNQIFHYAANPESDGSQIQQDYEFVILRATNDSIFLRGKKYGNKMVMTRLADDVSWTDEIAKIQQVDKDLMMTFTIRNNGDSIGTAELSDERIMELNADGNTIDMPYYVSTTGIVLLQPIQYKGASIQNLVYNTDKMSFSSPDNGAAALALEANLPENYMYYNEFAGTYTLSYRNGSRSIKNITLTPAGDGSTYHLTGLVPNATLTLTYNKKNGSLRLSTPQLAGSQGGIYYFILPWALADGGSVYFGSGYGMDLTKDTSKKGTVLTFGDTFTGRSIDSFIIAGFTSETQLGNSTFNGWDSPITFVTGSTQLPYVTSLTKTN